MTKEDTAKRHPPLQPPPHKPPPPPPDHPVSQEPISTRKDGDVMATGTPAIHRTARPGVSTQEDHVNPRAKNSGFPNRAANQADTDAFHQIYFPNQGLAPPDLHPDHPNVIVNQPFGSEPQILDTKRGIARYQRPNPETTGADFRPTNGPEGHSQAQV